MVGLLTSDLEGRLSIPILMGAEDAFGADPDDLSLVSDNVSAGRLAITHLVELGRRTIAHITGDATYGAAQDRAAGALAELTDRGLRLAGDRVLFGAWTEAWGRNATLNLETLGRVAAERLAAAFDGTLGSGVEQLPCRLVPRESTTGA